VNRTIAGLTVDMTYVDRVHRVYTADSLQGTYRGPMFLGNLAYQTPIGKLTGFAYLLSFDPLIEFPGVSVAAAAALNPALASTSTYGGRFAGEQTVGRVKIGYIATYASQQQRGDNPHTFENYYYLRELSASIGPLSGTLGDEVMQGNGTVGVATPLATTHAFDGWADMFLTTPVNGLENRYVSLAYMSASPGLFRNLALKATYRSFAPQRTSGDYGSEWDFQISRKWGRYTPAIVLADYRPRPARRPPSRVIRASWRCWWISVCRAQGAPAESLAPISQGPRSTSRNRRATLGSMSSAACRSASPPALSPFAARARPRA
jgi:hypothetical protein